MHDDDIDEFLAGQTVGVLGISTKAEPLLRPMSYAYHPPDRLYFLYILSESSRKATATDEAGRARFLVFHATARYDWESVLLAGTLRVIPEPEREGVEQSIDIGWRPEAFEHHSTPRNTRLYAFEITDRSGLSQDGPPPGYEPNL